MENSECLNSSDCMIRKSSDCVKKIKKHCVGISHKKYTRQTDCTDVKWKPKAYGRPFDHKYLQSNDRAGEVHTLQCRLLKVLDKHVSS